MLNLDPSVDQELAEGDIFELLASTISSGVLKATALNGLP